MGGTVRRYTGYPKSGTEGSELKSRGVLSSNAIGASGMIRMAESALQVRGLAGEHQVDGAKLALGQAYGGNAQYFAMATFASTL